MRMRLALASMFACLSGPALAEVVPLVPQMDPSRPAEIRARFHSALSAGLAAAGAKVISLRRVKRAAPRPCGDATCAQRLSRRFRSANVATANVSSVGKNYTITVAIYSTGQVLQRVSQRCDICTLSEALRATRQTANRAVSKANLSITAAQMPEQPVDNKARLAPVSRPRPKRRRIVARSVAPSPSKRTSKAAKRPWPLWPAVVAVSAGVVGIAVGIPLLAIDGKFTNCVGEPRPDNRNCRDIYNTSGGGALAIGLGASALAAAGVLFYLHFDSKPETAVSIRPAAGGAVVSAVHTF